jgi:hypothetical protein
MAEIKNLKQGPVIDYMARDYDSLLYSMRSLIPYKLPEWKDYEAEADFGNVLLQLFAHMGDILSYYQDRIANESFLGTARERGSIIHHLRLIGYWLSTPAPAVAFLDIQVPEDCTETVTITKGDAFGTKSEKDKSSVRFEYTGGSDLVIDFSTITVLDEKKTYSGVPVEEGRLVKEEIIGESAGTPNQRFPLSHSPLILRARGPGEGLRKDITLLTQLGDHIEEWTLQESLAFSKQGQAHYMMEIDEGDRAEIIFGDGEFGVIPPPGAVIKVTYRVGGGIHGNVAPRTIDTIVDAPDLALLGAEVINPGPATGGADRESIQHAIKNAPAVFRSYKRAVTAEDYMALALKVSGVGKVRAEKAGWNSVSLFVAPQGGGKVSDLLKKDLMVYFEDKRPITTVVEIEDVDYVPVYVTVKVGIASYYSPGEIKEKVMAAGEQLLAFDNVDFAQTLYISKFYEAIEAIAGVDHAAIVEFRREDTQTTDHLESGKIELDKNEIPVIPSGEGNEMYARGINVIIE